MNTKSIDKTENICKHCGETYTVFERNRVYGANPQMSGYCSAGCYTESIFNPKPTPPAKSIDKTFEEYLAEHPYPDTRSFTKDDWETSMYENWFEEYQKPKSIDKEVLETDFTAITLMGEQLDGERLCDLIKYFRMLRKENETNERILTKLLSVHSKRFGFPFPR